MKNAFAPSILKLLGGVSLAFFIALPSSVHAQQATDATPSQDESNKQLLQRMRLLRDLQPHLVSPVLLPVLLLRPHQQ